jgi:hypothetical protein
MLHDASPYGSAWMFKQVAHGELEGFQSPTFAPDSTWATGVTPFGNALAGTQGAAGGDEAEQTDSGDGPAKWRDPGILAAIGSAGQTIADQKIVTVEVTAQIVKVIVTSP